MIAHLALGFAVAAFLVRAGLYLAMPGIVYPDETFQYLEQAHRLLGHHGVVPWEIHARMRSWLLPGIVAALLTPARMLLEEPTQAVRAVGVAMAAWSALGVWVAVRWGAMLGGPAAAVLCGAFALGSVELTYFSPHPLAETIAAPVLTMGAWLVQGAPSARRLAAAAALLALAGYMRLPLAPAGLLCMGLAVWPAPRERWRPLIGGAAAVLLLAAVFDWITLGTPLQSVWLNVWLNLVQGVAAAFGIAPWHAYLRWTAAVWGGLAPVLMVLVLLGARRAHVPMALGVAIVVPLMLIGHKEHRFISPALPFLVLAAGIGAAQALGWARRRNTLLLAAVAGAVWLAASAAHALLWPRGMPWRDGVGVIEASAAINADPGACGVAVEPRWFWPHAGGHVHLRAGLPLYGIGPSDTMAAERASANYIFRRSGFPGQPQGYVQLGCWPTAQQSRAACLWHRPGPCDPAAALPLAERQLPLGPPM